jgi:hypothetical protein
MIRKSGSRFSETIMLQNRNLTARWRLILKLSRSRPRRLNISAAALARIDDRIDAAIDDRPSSERTNSTLLRELDAPILSHFLRYPGADPKRLMQIIEGELVLNDASSLVYIGFSVAAALTTPSARSSAQISI